MVTLGPSWHVSMGSARRSWSCWLKETEERKQEIAYREEKDVVRFGDESALCKTRRSARDQNNKRVFAGNLEKPNLPAQIEAQKKKPISVINGCETQWV